MSYQLVHSGFYRGEHLDPPEFRSDDPVSCSECLAEYDAEEDFGELHTVAGQYVCRSCVETCDVCGEWMDDTTRDLGPTVRFREWANDGKLIGGAHALCAAEYLSELLESSPRLVA